jgi:hypothetical protein
VTGAPWIVSYVVLCFAVLCIGLAVAALYRLLGHSRTATSAGLAWPFAQVMPGRPLPELSFQPGQPGLPKTGLVCFATGEHDGYSTAVSMAAVARAWRHDFLIAVREGGVLDWPTDLPHDLQSHLARIATDDFQKLGMDFAPVVALLLDGCVVEAIAGLTSPSAIRSYFVSLAMQRAPSVSTASRRREVQL